MHIALRTGRRPSGGMSAFVRNLSSQLAQNQQVSQVSLLCMGQEWPDVGDVRQIPLGATNMAGEYQLDARGIAKICDRENIDFLLCPGNQVSRTKGRSVWWPLTVAPFEEIAVSSIATDSRQKARWAAVRKSLVLSAGLADRIVYSSNYTRALYEAGVGDRASKKPSIVIPPSTSIPIRDRILDGRRFFLSVSNFNRYKFVEETVRGFADFRLSSGSDWDLVLAGSFPDPAYEKSVVSLIERLGLEDSVELAGRKDADGLADLYESASGYIFMSVSENAASYTVIDALAYGLPTVSSFYSSSPEILRNAVHYVDPFEPDRIRDGLAIIAEPREAERLSTLALERAAGFPTWTGIAQELVDFLVV